MTDYITSDLHFYHGKIMEHCPNTRKFYDLNHMHEVIISNINGCLKSDDDHLYILGDFSFKGKEKTLEILYQIPCHKITLVLGNHDKRLESLYKEYFKEVCWYKEVDVKYNWMNEKVKVCMMHFPIEQGQWNRAHHGSIQMHGHCHGQFKTGNRRRDVGWDGKGMIHSLEKVVRDCLHDPVEKIHHTKS